MGEIEYIRARLNEKRKPEKVPFLKRILATPFDVIGVMVPDSRAIAKDYKNMNTYDMYNFFDELWNSNIHEEKSLAIHILQQYKKKFNLETWRFLKQRLDKAKTWDHIDALATDVFAEILLKNPYLMTEIKEMASSRNPWERRLAIESTLKMIRKNKIDLTLRLAEKLVYDENTYVQKGAGWMIREAGKKNRLAVREFIIQYIDMKPVAFSYATEKMKELRKMRKEKSKNNFKEDKLFENENDRLEKTETE